MVFQRKKRSPIERRLAELQQEMSRVNRDLKTADRGKVSHIGVGAPAMRPAVLPAGFGPAGEAEPAAGDAPAAGSVDPGAGDLFSHAAQNTAATDQPSDLFPDIPVKSVIPPRRPAPPAAESDRPSGRERFAHYFMAGHFQNLRPPRQTGRVIRNKAIIMAIMALILGIWLFYWARNYFF